MEHEHEGLGRREIPQRSAGWARRSAGALAALGLTPNRISLLSLLIAVAAAAALLGAGLSGAAARPWLLVGAAVAMPLRLLCNMLDGMLAVEHGLSTPEGDLFNEVPDRLADLVILAAAGYATCGVWRGGGHDLGVAIGWAAGAAAVLTAYVRTLGAANGVGNFFDGLMAKPTRMWALVLACLASLAEPALGWPSGVVLAVALAGILLGSLQTIAVRLARIARALRARGAR
ncbi:hypothetical protein USB125703_00202 [Pseudoclavibacter triregionum]|nr:hypothetical protein USB125703_00202 [Pseudoclavibacter triregionum]